MIIIYNYDFSDEKVVFESRNNFIEFAKKEMFLNILITNKNILLFRDIKKDSPLSGREMYIMPQYELFELIPLNKLNYEVIHNNTIINNGEVIIYNVDLDKIIE